MTTIETTEAAEITRKRCRNPRCRMKLPAPTDNEHHAFCTRGCYEGFYRSRCRVCEADLRKTGKRGDANRRFCRPPNRCAAEAQKWPEKYAFGMLPLSPPVQRGNNVRNAHFTASETAFTGERPSARCLRSWSWHSDDVEHELRAADGALLARLESNAGRHRLTFPRTFPILSWGNLAEAMHRAESIALSALPLEPASAARIKRDNATPHPMGAPASLQLLPVVDSPPIAPAEPFEGDPLEMPQFLRRTAL